jgi:pimeloyl-ACP methyl ester carboxylesterase
MEMGGTGRAWLRLALCGWVLFLATGCQKEEVEPNVDIVRSAPGARVAVVFVHGILGHARNTFAAEGKAPWFDLLANDKSLAGPVHFLSLAYASEPLQRASSIQEIATRLRSSLQVERGVFKNFDKVIFVAHSMGGLVVRRLLLQLSRDDPDAYAKVAAVFFLAVPAGGSDLASDASWVSGNPQFENMRPEDMNVFLQADADDWATLMRRRPAGRPYPRSYCAYENKALGPWVVVPRSRSQMLCDETPVAFDRDHSTLVKPADADDPVYRFLAARLNRLLADEDIPLSVTLQLLAPTKQPLPDGLPLRSGDQFAIQVRATRPAWLYVFGIDGKGRLQRYFPSVAGGSLVATARELRVPQETGGILVLDNVKGVEQFIAIATLRPDGRLEKLGEQAVPMNQGNLHADVEAALALRGAFFARARSTHSTQTRELAVELNAAAGRARATLTFLHN